MPAWIWYGLGAVGGGALLWWAFGSSASSGQPGDVPAARLGPGGSQTPLGPGVTGSASQFPIAYTPLGPGVMGTGTLPSPT